MESGGMGLLEVFQVERWQSQTCGAEGALFPHVRMGKLRPRMAKRLGPEPGSQLESEPEFEPQMCEGAPVASRVLQG